MIARLFIYIYDRTSYGFAVAIFTTTCSWIASLYGFYFVHATISFNREELFYVLPGLILFTGVAVLMHLTHYGMFFKIGCHGFTSKIKLMNRYFDKKYIFLNYKTIDSGELVKVYSAISSLPTRNLLTGVMYGGGVILLFIIYISIQFKDFEKVFFLIIGSLFALLIIGYFTFLLTEYFSGPYKMRLEQILFERSINVKPRNLLSFNRKAFNMMLLVLFSMINLTILVQRSEKSKLVIGFFIILTLVMVGLLLSLMLSIMRWSLQTINRSTRKLAAGGSGMFFPPFSDKEFTTFSVNYNHAALEINEIRTDLEKKIRERTEELSAAYERLNSAYGQIQADLTLAKRLQKRIMPENFDSIEDVDLVVHYYPMADIGGDIYDIFQPYPGYIRIFLADAIGHGIQAALITMIIKGEYEKVKTIEDAWELLEWLNKSFTDLYMSLNAFFSCILIDIDINKKKIRYSSAGHPDQIHISDDSIELMKHTGKLIGIQRDTAYECIEKDLGRHDKIILFTDGLFEQLNDREEVFTEQHIMALAEKMKSKPVRELDEMIISSLREFMGGSEVISVRDDITLISIEINGK